ncbi:MAG: hypothetical protein Hens3KO_00780 [Henriciella sp.]
MDWFDNVRFFFVSSPSDEPNNFVYHYQALISGILATVAAVATIVFLDKQHRNVQKRKHTSAISNLPIAFSNLHDYANQCLQILSDILRDHDDDVDIRVTFRVPSLPLEAIRMITDVIETCDQQSANQLQALLRFTQVQHARLKGTQRDLSPDRPTGHLTIASNVRSDVTDACVLRLMLDHMYPFARAKESKIPLFSGDNFTPSMGYRIDSLFDQATRETVQAALLSSMTSYLDSTQD